MYHNIHCNQILQNSARWVELYGVAAADIRLHKYKETHKGLQAGEKHGMFGKTHTNKVKQKLSMLAAERTGTKSNRYIHIDMLQLQALVEQKISIKNIAEIMDLSIFIVSKRIKTL